MSGIFINILLAWYYRTPKPFHFPNSSMICNVWSSIRLSKISIKKFLWNHEILKVKISLDKNVNNNQMSMLLSDRRNCYLGNTNLRNFNANNR